MIELRPNLQEALGSRSIEILAVKEENMQLTTGGLGEGVIIFDQGLGGDDSASTIRIGAKNVGFCG